MCRAAGAELIVNARPTIVDSSGADGVHLSSAQLMELDSRPLDKNQWVAASCHNATELEQAERIDVDFVVVGPVHRTASHPQARPIGWRELSRLADKTPLPVYALGGMQAPDLGPAVRSGCQGVAMISGLWSVPDTRLAMNEACSALNEAEIQIPQH